MTTRSATRPVNSDEQVSVGLRRSPRNLPQHLKKKVEQFPPWWDDGCSFAIASRAAAFREFKKYPGRCLEEYERKSRTWKKLEAQSQKESSQVKEQVEPKSGKEPYIETLPPIVFQGRIQYANDFFNCAQICDNLLQEIKASKKEIVPIGFDLEWPFSFQTGSGKTALVQIYLGDDVCYLLHIYSLKKLPAAFTELLYHPKVKLVGVNIKNDVRKLGRDFKEFHAQKVVESNCHDCGPYANQVLKRSCRWSLERLTAYLLNKKISKDPEVRRSKWHIEPLSDAQKSYAATDAYVSFLLYTTIQAKATALAEESQNEDPVNSPF